MSAAHREVVLVVVLVPGILLNDLVLRAILGFFDDLDGWRAVGAFSDPYKGEGEDDDEVRSVYVRDARS